MEKKHRCKLCFRNFANGRALGGHMRSHMMKFYAEEKASKHENGDDDDFADHDFQSLNSYSLPSSSSSEEEEEYEEGEETEAAVRGYELRENPKKSAIMADHDSSSAVVVQGGESETESSEKINPICRRRSKRVRETRISDFDVFRVKKKWRLIEEEEDGEEGKGNIVNEQLSPVSSISDFTPEENVAHCLIMLSKDKWENIKVERENHEDDEEEEEESKKFGDYDAKMVKNKFRGKYRCEECNKLFRSYQALGGHRASHKKIKAAAAVPPQTAEKNGGQAKVHQCPFCDRIFSSGQALGGHKRSHFIGAGAISSNYNHPIEKNSKISQVFSIDLNLPAPVEDDEGSQIAISAVSDAEFVADVKQ